MGRSKNHIPKSTFKQYFKPTQHKGRRIPLHLVDKVEELKKLVDDKQIIQLEKGSDEYFISPVVITVKSDNKKISTRFKRIKQRNSQKKTKTRRKASTTSWTRYRRKLANYKTKQAQFISPK